MYLARKPLWVRRSFLRPTIMDKQHKALDACIQNFLRVSTLCRVGGERTARLIRKVFFVFSEHLAPVVQKVDSTIHRINLYPLGSSIGSPNIYPLDSDLSGG